MRRSNFPDLTSSSEMRRSNEFKSCFTIREANGLDKLQIPSNCQRSCFIVRDEKVNFSSDLASSSEMRRSTFLQILLHQKGDVVALKGKLTTVANVKSNSMNIPRRGRVHNLSNKPNNSSVDMAIDQGEEDNPIICQDGLKSPRNVSTSSVSEVKRLWESSTGFIPDRLKVVRIGLDCWYRKLRAARKVTITDLKRRIEHISEMPPSDDNLGDLIESRLALNLEIDKSELYWEQRARANWLKHGDNNSSFFHRFASQRKRRNTIRFLEDAHGSGTESEQRFQEIAQEYFSSLFTSDYSQNCSSILNGIHPIVDDAMNTSLLADFQKADVLNAVKSMGPMKAAGEDGLGAILAYFG
ncbi:hypothetical protein GQ457_12G027170 [Hibiscus cannabinus]